MKEIQSHSGDSHATPSRHAFDPTARSIRRGLPVVALGLAATFGLSGCMDGGQPVTVHAGAQYKGSTEQGLTTIQSAMTIIANKALALEAQGYAHFTPSGDNNTSEVEIDVDYNTSGRRVDTIDITVVMPNDKAGKPEASKADYVGINGDAIERDPLYVWDTLVLAGPGGEQDAADDAFLQNNYANGYEAGESGYYDTLPNAQGLVEELGGVYDTTYSAQFVGGSPVKTAAAIDTDAVNILALVDNYYTTEQ